MRGHQQQALRPDVVNEIRLLIVKQSLTSSDEKLTWKRLTIMRNCSKRSWTKC